MSNRKKIDIAALAGAKPAASGESAADTATVTTVRMHQVVGNPDNPRTTAEYTDEDPDFVELKRAMQQVGQLQPIAVVSRDVWLRHLPQHEKQVGAAKYVALGGNRRLAAARQLRWTLIDVRVQDHLGAGDEHQLDESVLIDNIHRKEIAPCKEARFLKRMVAKHGSQEAVAERIGKSQMYVSHRLALLKLAPDLQDLVDAKEFKLKPARELAGRTEDHEEQRAAYKRLVTPKPAVREQEPEPARDAPEAQDVQNPVLKKAAPTVPGQAESPDTSVVQNPVLKSASAPEVPEPASATSSPQTAPPAQSSAGAVQNPVLTSPRAQEANGSLAVVDSIDWADPEGLVELLVAHMTVNHRKKLASLLFKANQDS
jgi:ParB family chromosome partitioning protein